MKMINEWLGAGFLPLGMAYGLSFVVLLVGSLTDLKTREVPDWVNYGLIFSGIGLNMLFSFIYFDQSVIVKEISFNNAIVSQYIISPQSYFMKSIVGLIVFFGIAYMMFYAGQWGGGDSKMIMGLGAMLGLDLSLRHGFMLGFLINALFAGAVYGLLWSAFLVVKNRRKFWREFSKALSKKEAARAKKLVAVASAALLILFFAVKLPFMRLVMLSFALLILITFYLWIFVKAVEKSCMYKLVEPSKLTEGDWIVNDVYSGGKYICGPKDLGIEKSQIRRLIELRKKRKINRILIKEGIPFVPSFLIAFIITLLFGNPLSWIL